MSKSFKRLSFLFIFIFLFVFLFSCDKPVNSKSAYELAVENGYMGTEKQWLAALKGKDGKEIKSALVNSDGDLIITYSDDTVVNAGHIESKVEESYLDFYPLPDGTFGVFSFRGQYVENIIIPSTHNGKIVSTILPHAFSSMEHHMKSIEIPNTITVIGEDAFSNCKSLTNVTIPKTVTIIGNSAFSNCKNLTKVYYAGISPYTDTITSINDNTYLTKATWYYFTANGSAETKTGNWWYYDADGSTIIEKIVE